MSDSFVQRYDRIKNQINYINNNILSSFRTNDENFINENFITRVINLIINIYKKNYINKLQADIGYMDNLLTQYNENELNNNDKKIIKYTKNCAKKLNKIYLFLLIPRTFEILYRYYNMLGHSIRIDVNDNRTFEDPFCLLVIQTENNIISTFSEINLSIPETKKAINSYFQTNTKINLSLENGIYFIPNLNYEKNIITQLNEKINAINGQEGGRKKKTRKNIKTKKNNL